MSSSPYSPAAKLLNQIFAQRKGLKTLAYKRNGELACSKTTYAQCSHVLERKPLLDRLRKEVLMDLEAKNQGLLYVLLYELLLGPNRSIRGGGALKRQLVSHLEVLTEKLSELEEEYPTKSSSTNENKVTIPRYVRVNSLKTSTKKVLSQLKDKISPIYLDPHVPDVLVMPPTSQTRGQLQNLVSAQEVILQDKSSCFSALCLVDGYSTYLPPKCEFIDACAAPGNKTSHLASLVSADSRIHAFDKSPDRFKLLQRRMKEIVGPKVQCQELDFLETSSESNFGKVQAILLDPSCSGSGMTSNHQEANQDPTFYSDRLQSLSDFQLKTLEHAATAFDRVERVVYSTCSLYLQENERVVQRFLASTDEWRLIAPTCLENWERRGLELEGLTAEQSKALIRVHPEEDATNGFFVACFERIKSKKNEKLPREATWKGVFLPKGYAYYDANQFHGSDQNKDKISSKMTDQATSSSAPKDSTTASANKRKAAVQPSPASSETAISKKRSKKMEWKKKQKQRKFERLDKKQDE